MPRLFTIVVVVAVASLAWLARADAPLPGDYPRTSVVAVNALWTLLGNSPVPPLQAATSLHQACAGEGFTFVRVAGTAFWPIQLAKYQSDHSGYMAAVEQLYNASNAAGCKVLLSLFWNWHAVPDLFGEHLGAAFRNTSSASRAFWRQYVSDVVSVAAKYPDAVGGWELGNELSLLADLNMSDSRNGCDPHMGTPAFRTMADNFSTTDMIDFEVWLADVIREEAASAGAPYSLISTGHSVPRPAAEHLRTSYHSPRRDWTMDTKAEFKKNLQETCACCELCSIHYYEHSGDGRWGIAANSTEPIAVALKAFDGATNKTLYVGEFGDKVSADVAARPFTRAMLKRQRESGVRLMTLWVWEFYQFSATEMAPFSISPSVPQDADIIAELRANNNAPQP